MLLLVLSLLGMEVARCLISRSVAAWHDMTALPLPDVCSGISVPAAPARLVLVQEKPKVLHLSILARCPCS